MTITFNSDDLVRQLNHWKNTGTYPYFPVIAGFRDGVAILENGQEVLMFGSCDYLGLARDEDLKQQATAAIETFGTNTFGAQIFSGHTVIHRDLQCSLAEFLQKEDALLFPSGMHTNIGILSALMGKEDVIINDRLNHVSIFMGAHFSQAQVRNYAHKDLNKLEAILAQSMDKCNRLIVTDGLFSADGDYAELDRICELADRYDAQVMVDEAHSIGVCGPNGRGVCEHYGVLERVDLVMGTMSKGLGSVGGFVAGRAELVDGLRYAASSYTSSRGSAPAVAAASLAAVRKVQEHGGRTLREKVWHNTALLIEGLKECGVDIGNTCSYVVPVMIGSSDTTVKVAHWLLEQGLFASAMIAPSVPPGKARLRLGVTTWQSEQDINRAVALIAEAKSVYGF